MIPQQRLDGILAKRQILRQERLIHKRQIGNKDTQKSH